MNNTDRLAFSLLLLEGHTKKAEMLAPLFRGVGRAGGVAAKGVNLASEVPGMLARGGGRFAKGLAKIPGQAMEEMRAGYGGAPIFNRTPKVNPFAGNVPNEALESMGVGARTTWPEAMPMGTTAGERATNALPPSTAGAGSGGGNQISGAGEGPGVDAAQQYWKPKTRMQNFGSFINQMPAERLRRSLGLATGGGRTLADVGRRGAMMGGAGLYGGAVAAEAPGKMQENAKYQWQQQHPLMARLGQMLGVMPEAHYRNYFNPLA